MYRYGGIVIQRMIPEVAEIKLFIICILQVPLIYFRYQYFPVSFLVSIEFEFGRGISSILFIHPTPEGIQTHPSAVPCSRAELLQHNNKEEHFIIIVTNSMSWDRRSPNFTSTVSLLLLTGRMSRLYVLSKSSYRRLASGLAAPNCAQQRRTTPAYRVLHPLLGFHFILSSQGTGHTG